MITEVTKFNNINYSVTPIVIGLDLAASNLSGAATAAPGQPVAVTFRIDDKGTTPAPEFGYRISLVTRTEDGGTPTMTADSGITLASGTIAFDGGTTALATINPTLPGLVAQGEYVYALQVDPTNQVVEALETNNVRFSLNGLSVRRPDLQLAGASLVEPSSGSPIDVARLGERATFAVRLTNPTGVPTAGFAIGLVMSNDSTLSLLSDTYLGEFGVDGGLPGIGASDGGVTSIEATIPVSLPLTSRPDGGGVPLATGQYYFFAVADIRGAVSELDEGNNNRLIGPVRLTAPGPDLAVTTVQVASAAGVGETIPVFRTLRNVGNVDAPAAAYRYFASANNIITPDDVPLEIVTGGTTSMSGSVTLARDGSSSATDLVRLPALMPPGTYFVGCIIDPAGQVAELDETNNGRASASIPVAASALRINAVQLPDATLGVPYLFRLSATGESGASSWSVVDAQGALPAGLALATDGTLSGTPTGTQAAVAAFTVVLSNGGRQAQARVAMRVLPQSAQLDITTTSLPAIVNATSTVVNSNLGAAGGIRPYTWRVASGVLPSGLVLTSEGVLTGSPRAGSPDGATNLTVEVRDVTGATARRVLAVRLVAAGGPVIAASSLPIGVVNGDYVKDIGLAGAANDSYFWSVTGLPSGLTTRTFSNIITIEGRPTRAGNFAVRVSVTDSRGRTDVVDYVLRVYASTYRLAAPAELAAAFRRGQAVTGAFSVTPASSVTYRVVSGQLPPGVTLATDGTLSGTVADEANLVNYNFVVEAADSAGATGLGPFVLKVEAPPVASMGCSTSGAVGGVPLLFAALGLLRRRLSRQRRRAGAAGVLATLLLVPLASQAQVSYQVDGPNALTGAYTPLATGTGATAIAAGDAVTLPFNFDFFGVATNVVAVSRNGYLALGGSATSTSSNQPIPHTDSSSANVIIAAWWDNLLSTTTAPATQLLYQTRTSGTGERFVVFEWANVRPNSTSAAPFSFQAHLFEGTGQIRFVYGGTAPATASASIGAQRALGSGVGALGCTTTAGCSPTDFPRNASIDLLLPPELRVASLSLDQTGFAGVGLRAAANVRNSGGRPATNVGVRFYLSTTTSFDRMSAVVMSPDCTVPSLAANQEATTAVCAPVIPTGTAVGRYYVFAEVDPLQQFTEQNENNNVSTPVALDVGMAMPDLSVTNVTAPTMAAPGASVSVARTLSNVGNAPSAGFSYSYYLSENNVVTISDRFLAPTKTSAALTPGTPDMGSDMVTLPSDLIPGNYWIGVCVNIDGSMANAQFAATEITVGNNCAGTASAIAVTAGSVAVATMTLPAGVKHAPYGVRLQATGGSGVYAWTVGAGTLPLGMTLTATGDLVGTPSATGTFSFEARVASNSQMASRMLSLMIADGNLPLVIVDQELSAAEFGRDYRGQLVAVGGRPPYAWSLKAGAQLPAGLGLASDGRIEGRASEGGEVSFTAVVTDAANATAEKPLRLKVVNPITLAVGTSALQRGFVRAEYQQRLIAVGGRAPYTWSVVSFQKLPENATEAPGPVDNKLPPFDEFGLQIMSDTTATFLSGTPKKAGLYALTLNVRDGSSADDTASYVLQISYREPLAITTTLLPDAFTGQQYSAGLSHNASRDAVVKFQAPCKSADGAEDKCVCVRKPTADGTFACELAPTLEQLPAGLELDESGAIIGSPTAEPGTYAFLVKAVDASGRQDTRSLSIRVRNDFAVQRSGCSTGGAGLALLGALSWVGLALRRRGARRG